MENEFLNPRRLKAFKKEKLSLISLFFLIVCCGISFTAELWANNRPVYLRFHGESYFPAIIRYHPSVFGFNDDFITDYKKVAPLADKVIWPIVRWSPNETNPGVSQYPGPPSEQNWFGTDDRGRDVLARLIYGFRYSMIYALLVWIASTIMAVAAGAVMGYFGGWVDITGQRVLEVIETVPTLMILLILVMVFQPSLLLLVVISCAFGWMGLSRYMRGEFLRLRHLPFVEFARAQGTSHTRIIFKHVLPNAMTPLLTFSPFMIAGNIYSLSALDYLGFGLPPPTSSWGELLSQAKENVTIAWWLAFYPSIALFGTLMLLTLLGNGMRRAFDPKANA